MCKRFLAFIMTGLLALNVLMPSVLQAIEPAVHINTLAWSDVERCLKQLEEKAKLITAQVATTQQATQGNQLKSLLVSGRFAPLQNLFTANSIFSVLPTKVNELETSIQAFAGDVDALLTKYTEFISVIEQCRHQLKHQKQQYLQALQAQPGILPRNQQNPSAKQPSVVEQINNQLGQEEAQDEDGWGFGSLLQWFKNNPVTTVLSLVGIYALYARFTGSWPFNEAVQPAAVPAPAAPQPAAAPAPQPGPQAAPPAPQGEGNPAQPAVAQQAPAGDPVQQPQ